ncbi:MAG: hypothetical protein IJO75_02280 [Clostridia bacterium]|nr:hypothetical protein [Clostridia bacterium]
MIVGSKYSFLILGPSHRYRNISAKCHDHDFGFFPRSGVHPACVVRVVVTAVSVVVLDCCGFLLDETEALELEEALRVEVALLRVVLAPVLTDVLSVACVSISKIKSSPSDSS